MAARNDLLQKQIDKLKYNLVMAHEEVRLAYKGRAQIQVELEKSWDENKRLIEALGRAEINVLLQIKSRIHSEMDHIDNGGHKTRFLIFIQERIDERVIALDGEF